SRTTTASAHARSSQQAPPRAKRITALPCREVPGDRLEVEHAPPLRQVVVPGIVTAAGVGALGISVLVKSEPGTVAGGLEGEADARVPAGLPLGEPPHLDDAAGRNEFDVPAGDAAAERAVLVPLRRPGLPVHAGQGRQRTGVGE